MVKKAVLFVTLATIFVALFSMQVSAFSIETIHGEIIKSETLLEKGPILLDFWSTSCRPCLSKLPHVSRFATKYPEMSFFAISTDSPRHKDNVMRQIRSSRYEFTTGFDGTRNLQRLFNVTAIPRTIIINQTGQIVYDNTGYNSGDEVKLEETIVKILSGEFESSIQGE